MVFFFYFHIFHQWVEETAIYNRFPQNKGRRNMIIQTETLSDYFLLYISLVGSHSCNFIKHRV